MTDVHFVMTYPQPPHVVRPALTDPVAVAGWTIKANPEGYSADVGTQFRFVGRPVFGWRASSTARSSRRRSRTPFASPAKTSRIRRCLSAPQAQARDLARTLGVLNSDVRTALGNRAAGSAPLRSDLPPDPAGKAAARLRAADAESRVPTLQAKRP